MSEQHRNFDVFLHNETNIIIYVEEYNFATGKTTKMHHTLTPDRLREIVEQGQRVVNELEKEKKNEKGTI
jgi:hypothetical protein